MFNFFFRPPSDSRAKKNSFRCAGRFSWVLGFFFLTTLGGCLTLPPLPKADLSQPGWNIRQGEAVWKPDRKTPEIAGEILLATRPDGSSFVQFIKTPFPFAITQTTSNKWQAEFPPQNKRFTAPGKPPARIIWFQLVNAVTDNPLARGWTWHDTGTNWQLKSSSGESLEGYLSQ
jgi:hypothetical protein